MTLITRIVLLVLAVPFVLAGGSGCGQGQFKWNQKNTCLPYGGPSTSPSPPSNKDCPSNWSWNNGQACCAPHQPPESSPPPQCRTGWTWSSGSLCCNPTSTPSNPSKPPTPSGYQGKNSNDNDNNNKSGWRRRVDAEKRQYRSRSVAPCPLHLFACPVSSLVGGDYECVDTLSDLDNCGGCAALSEGQNCNAIPGVWNVGCEQSVCKIYTCADGYTLSKDGKSCHLL